MAIKRTDFAMKMLEFELSLIGKTVQEARSNRLWNFKWVISEEKQKEFEKYFIQQALKTYKVPKKKVITNILNPFLLQWGLNVKKS